MSLYVHGKGLDMYSGSPSQINVTKWASQGIKQIPELNLRSQRPQILNIIQRRIRRGRIIENSSRPSNIGQTLGQMRGLPDPPCTIQHAMVEPECRIARGRKKISAWVAVHSEMSCGMGAEKSYWEIPL